VLNIYDQFYYTYIINVKYDWKDEDGDDEDDDNVNEKSVKRFQPNAYVIMYCTTVSLAYSTVLYSCQFTSSRSAATAWKCFSSYIGPYSLGRVEITPKVFINWSFLKC